MDIRQHLASGHSKQLTSELEKHVGADKKKFADLLDIFFEGNYRLSQRSAWAISNIVIKNPSMAKPYLGKFIKLLKEPGHHPAIARNILRIMQEMEIPDVISGELLDLCLNFMRDEKNPVAIRAFAITVASNIAEPFPELKKEVLILLEELRPLAEKPAIKQRIKVALKKLL